MSRCTDLSHHCSTRDVEHDSGYPRRFIRRQEFGGTFVDAGSVGIDEQVFSLYAATESRLFIGETGGMAQVWTGSANATNAAFGGNVEFLVELEGDKSSCGIDAFLVERLFDRWERRWGRAETDPHTARLQALVGVARV